MYEQGLGTHKESGGRLKEPSAALGFLWIRRSIAFQCRFLELLLQHPTSLQAATQAYHEELEPFHGHALQKIFKTALRFNLPPKSTILLKLSRPKCSLPSPDVLVDMQAFVDILSPVRFHATPEVKCKDYLKSKLLTSRLTAIGTLEVNFP